MTLDPSSEPTQLGLSDLSRIAQDLQIRKSQVESVIQLLDEGNTIPFITRYRKERTGGLNENVIRHIHERVQLARQLAERKQTILKTIEAQGRLTDELKAAILAAENPRRLDDLYLPFKPKRKVPSAEARERGLEPLATAIWNADPAVANLDECVNGMVDPEKKLNSADDVLGGAKQILAEMIAESAELRSAVRRVLWEHCKLTVTKNEKLAEGKGLEYKDYFQFTEPVMRVPPHRILAINRGERENALTVRFESDPDGIRRAASDALPALADHAHKDLLLTVLEDSIVKLVLPALEREIRRDLTDRAMRHAIEVFARNLRGLLMQPPLRGKRVLAADPGFRTGCRLAALDERGNLLEDCIVFPHAPQRKLELAKLHIERLIRRHQISVVALGNGTASRETEEIIGDLIGTFDKRRRGELPTHPVITFFEPKAEEPPQPVATPPEPTPEIPVQIEFASPQILVTDPNAVQQPAAEPAPPENKAAQEEEAALVALKTEVAELREPPADLAYVIVNEAGASDYSASAVGREEFPALDASLRGTISIGRRLQDPLSELVKIDPQHVGVGLYQHDVHGKHLKASLESVIESCVNHVGVDLNSAGVPLLRYVAGLNQLIAREICDHRQKNGPFRRREQLADLPAVGPARYVQMAGFVRIADGDEPLDSTWIHPENYGLARQVVAELGHQPDDVRDASKVEEMRDKFNQLNLPEFAQKMAAGLPTVDDILFGLARPGRDPRDDHPPPIFRRDVLKLEDLQAGMELKGTVLNVVDFGAFVDIGLKDSGLVHISQLANRYIRSPHEVVTVGDVVAVWVMTIDTERRRVSLTMIPPGTPRQTAQERPAPRSSRGRDTEPSEQGGETRSRPGADDRQRQQRGRPRHDRRGPLPDRRGPADRPLPTGQPSEVVPERPTRPERKPRPPKPLPTLTKEKKEGKAYLNTLGELEAYFKARESGQSVQEPQTE